MSEEQTQVSVEPVAAETDPTADIDVAYTVAQKTNGEVVFDFQGKNLLAIAGLHQVATARIQDMLDTVQQRGHPLTHGMLDALLRMVTQPPQKRIITP